MRQRYPIYFALAMIALAAILSACGSHLPSPSPSKPTVTHDSQPDEISLPIDATTEIAIEQPEQISPSGYTRPSPDGPWLAFAANRAIWIANADGSGASQLTGSFAAVTSPIAAPSGGTAAYITAGRPNHGGLDLWILNLPSGQSDRITPLTSTNTETNPGTGVARGTPGFEIAHAIVELPSLAWSPDGTRLAFIGAMDGQSADLYVYSLSDGSITRLGDDPSQDYRPIWSPDGQYIVYAGASSFGTGAGYAMAGVWAAHAESGEVRLLYQPESSDEIFSGWTSQSVLLLHSWSAVCGAHNLRTIDIETGKVTPIWPGTFFVQDAGSGVAYDPVSDTVLLVLDEHSASSTCAIDGQAQKPGLYLIDINRPKPMYVSDLLADAHIWDSRQKAFLVCTEDGSIQVTTKGGITYLIAPTFSTTPITSPDGTEWLWIGSGFAYQPAGLWIGRVGRNKASPVSDASVYAASWSPDSRRVFFFTDGKLYVTDRPAGDPVSLADNIQHVDKAVWIIP
ncbi:MAG: PD40 domain-containing protein [Anaerolineae bacterium]|nr:PD40 domain-containing protein [Anaerolineae bacterium]